MYSLDELRLQNREIADLCEILSILVEQPELRKNAVVCELISRFTDRVWLHLVFEDKTFYSDLLAIDDPDTRALLEQFRASGHKLKKQFADYIRQWCMEEPDAASQASFVRESHDIMRQILERVKTENEDILPLVEHLHTA